MNTRVLLVEDNALSADMLSRRLIKRGFIVAVAADGVKALERAQAEPPDVVLMDIDLPEMDGWAVTRLLKANPATVHIPVIALTAHAMLSDRDHSIKAGCDEFETKPIDLPRLLAKIERLVAKGCVS